MTLTSQNQGEKLGLNDIYSRIQKVEILLQRYHQQQLLGSNQRDVLDGTPLWERETSSKVLDRISNELMSEDYPSSAMEDRQDEVHTESNLNAPDRNLIDCNRVPLHPNSVRRASCDSSSKSCAHTSSVSRIPSPFPRQRRYSTPPNRGVESRLPSSISSIPTLSTPIASSSSPGEENRHPESNKKSSTSSSFSNIKHVLATKRSISNTHTSSSKNVATSHTSSSSSFSRSLSNSKKSSSSSSSSFDICVSDLLKEAEEIISRNESKILPNEKRSSQQHAKNENTPTNVGMESSLSQEKTTKIKDNSHENSPLSDNWQSSLSPHNTHSSFSSVNSLSKTVSNQWTSNESPSSSNMNSNRSFSSPLVSSFANSSASAAAAAISTSTSTSTSVPETMTTISSPSVHSNPVNMESSSSVTNAVMNGGTKPTNISSQMTSSTKPRPLWKAYLDKKSGLYYYHNKLAGVTTWERPSDEEMEAIVIDNQVIFRTGIE